MTQETIVLVAAVAGHLLAVARLFNAFRQLYGWLPPKAQPVVIAAVAGLPPLADALLAAKSLEQVLLAVASGLTAFFMAVKGAPPAPPSSGSSSNSISDPEPTRVPVWRDSPDEPAELRAGLPWYHFLALQLRRRGLTMIVRPAATVLVVPALAFCACTPAQWQQQAEVADAVAQVSNQTVGPMLSQAYEIGGLAVIKLQPTPEEAQRAIGLYEAKWAPVWRAYDAFKLAHDRWQDIIATRGDPIPAAIAARQALCELRAAAREVDVRLPDFQPLRCGS